jgi:hypothetical protein
MPSVGLVGSGNISLKRVFCISEMVHLVRSVTASKFAPAGRHLIHLSLIVVLSVVASAVFLSVGPSLITIRFGSSEQLLSRGFSFRYDGGGGGS